MNGNDLCGKCRGKAKLMCTACTRSYCSKKCQADDWPDHKTLCKEVSREFKMVKEFTDKNPYPSYEELLSRLQKSDRPFPISLTSLYKENIHQFCKAIYENPVNMKKAREMGQNIYNEGGKEAMEACIYVLRMFSPTASSNSIQISGFWRMTEGWWDGIGTWVD